MKDTTKGVLGGRFKNTTQTSKSQTSRTTDVIVKNIKGSGNGPVHKGDKRILGVFLAEEKTVKKGGLSLRAGVIQKICEEAMEAGALIPMIIISSEDPNWPSTAPRDWAILPLDKVPFQVIKEAHDR